MLQDSLVVLERQASLEAQATQGPQVTLPPCQGF